MEIIPEHNYPINVSDTNEIATKDIWKNLPIDNPKQLQIYLEFNESQFSKIKNGLIPEEMEDKWFIYYEEEFLYFHRSWTGFGMYKTKITKEPTGYIIREFWVERNIEKLRWSIERRSCIYGRFLRTPNVSGEQDHFSHRSFHSKIHGHLQAFSR